LSSRKLNGSGINFIDTKITIQTAIIAQVTKGFEWQGAVSLMGIMAFSLILSMIVT
jgi:hypothetical protein